MLLRKATLAYLLTVSLLCMPYCLGAPPEAPEIRQPVQTAAEVRFDPSARVCWIRVTGMEMFMGTLQPSLRQASCVLIDEDTAVTAAHVYKDVEGYSTTVMYGEQEILADVEVMEKVDAAILELSEPIDILSLNVTVAKNNDSVVVFGSRTQHRQYGTVKQRGVIVLEEGSFGIRSGDSGGGVFAADGTFVGTLWGRDVEEDRLVFFTPSEDFSKHLTGSEERAPLAPDTTVKERIPRLILVTDIPAEGERSWCKFCEIQKRVLDEFRRWDKKNRWKIGDTSDSHIQILDDEDRRAFRYDVQAWPMWIREEGDRYYTLEGVQSKERIVEFSRGGGSGPYQH